MISLTDAEDQAKVLAQAAVGSPCRQVSYELRRRAREWKRAVDDLLTMGEDDYVIELMGSVTSGMLAVVPVALPYGDKEHKGCPVVRVLIRDGQCSLHVVPDETGRDVYVNCCSTASPVVVRK